MNYNVAIIYLNLILIRINSWEFINNIPDAST